MGGFSNEAILRYTSAYASPHPDSLLSFEVILASPHPTHPYPSSPLGFFLVGCWLSMRLRSSPSSGWKLQDGGLEGDVPNNGLENARLSPSHVKNQVISNTWARVTSWER